MSRPRSYSILLSDDEIQNLKKLRRHSVSYTFKQRCTILLIAGVENGTNLTYKQIAFKAGTSVTTVIHTLRKFHSRGLCGAISPNRNPNSDRARLKVTGDVQAKIIAKACSKVPQGHCRWTLTLLAKEMAVILEDRISRSTIGRILKANDLRPHLSEYWSIPPEENAEFVAAMEDVIDVYQQPYDYKRPLWCMDEKPYQLLDESRKPLPMRPGDITKIDSEYVRHGTVSIFCFIQPHSGTILHAVEPTRTAVDWAEKVRYLVDVVNPNAEKVVLVMDNLNVHSIASLYKAFEPAEARRIAKKLEIHYTPKHGSWLDIAEIGLNVMTRECLNRRIPSMEVLKGELAAWNKAYNEKPSPVRWQFNEEASRVKLQRLYPDISKHHRDRKQRCEEKSGS